MLTGRQSEVDERIVRFEGANDYLRKPFDAVTLVGRAEALIGGERPAF
jgi:DNA-binding response OmpR family regulator